MMMIEKTLVDGRWVSDGAPKAPPQPPTPEETAASEDRRRARREKAKRGLAAIKLAEQRYAELTAAIEQIESEKERLAAEHQASIAPLQAEMHVIEQRQIEAITSAQATDPSDERRRAELLARISTATAELATAIAGQDRLLAVAYRERNETSKCLSEGPAFEAELRESASPELRLALRVAIRSRDWAGSRLNAAQERLADGRDVAFWRAEHDAAARADAAAGEECSRAVAAIMSE